MSERYKMDYVNAEVSTITDTVIEQELTAEEIVTILNEHVKMIHSLRLENMKLKNVKNEYDDLNNKLNCLTEILEKKYNLNVFKLLEDAGGS